MNPPARREAARCVPPLGAKRRAAFPARPDSKRPDSPAHAEQPTAASFLTHYRREVRLLVARWTHEYQYTIDQVLGDIIVRCRELNLRLATPPEQAKLEFAVLLTVQTMNFLHSGQHRVAL